MKTNMNVFKRHPKQDPSQKIAIELGMNEMRES